MQAFSLGAKMFVLATTRLNHSKASVKTCNLICKIAAEQVVSNDRFDMGGKTRNIAIQLVL